VASWERDRTPSAFSGQSGRNLIDSPHARDCQLPGSYLGEPERRKTGSRRRSTRVGATTGGGSSLRPVSSSATWELPGYPTNVRRVLQEVENQKRGLSRRDPRFVPGRAENLLNFVWLYRSQYISRSAITFRQRRSGIVAPPHFSPPNGHSLGSAASHDVPVRSRSRTSRKPVRRHTGCLAEAGHQSGNAAPTIGRLCS